MNWIRVKWVVFVCMFLGFPVSKGFTQDFAAAFSGFSSVSRDLIQIEADTLEVRDSEKIAVYSGNVRVRQGDTLLRTSHLRIHYSGNIEQNVPGGSVRRIEATGKVVVTANGQTASGDTAVFEMATDIITLTGNVVLSEAGNVVKGEKLVVNLKTKKAQMAGGRVQTLFTPQRRN